MPLFNNTAALLNNGATSASTVSNGGDTGGTFAAAMESIGAALGELRSGIENLPSNIERAFVKAISSDAANESIYDAVASASYDAYSDAQADHGVASGLLPSMNTNVSRGDDKLPGRSFSLKELFATSEPASAAGDRKRMQDLQQNFYANLAPEFYTKGAKVFDKILAGDLDAAVIADNLNAIGAGDDGDGGSDWLDILSNASNLLPSRRGKKGKRGKNGKKSSGVGKGKDNSKPNSKFGNNTGGKGDNRKSPKDNKGNSQSEKNGKGESKETKKNSSKQGKPSSKNNPPKKTPTGPKGQASKAGQKVATEGTKAATKTGAKTAAKAGGRVAAKVGAKTALRAIPVVGQVAGTAMLAYDAYQIGSGLKELHDAAGASKETVNKMNDANLGNFKERQKDRPGGEARIAAYEETQKASTKLYDIQNSAGVMAFGNDERANTALREYYDIMNGKAKMEGAKESEPLDRETVKQYALSRIQGLGSGWTKDLAEALIDNAIASDKFNEVLANTSPNGREKPEGDSEKSGKDNAPGENKQPGENAQPGNRGASVANDVPMAAGSMENTAHTTVNAGTGVMTQDIMTMEAQMQQFKRFTFEGVRDALLLPEVQTMFNTTAQTAGAAVEQKLMG